MRKSAKNVSYSCPRLSRDVTLTLTFLHHDNDFNVVSKIECDSDRQCDIGSTDGRGGYSWNRELCPTLDYYKTKNDIHGMKKETLQ